MRVLQYLFVFICMFILTTAKPSLQDRLPPTKSTTVSQKYVLLGPVSAALSYIYYANQPLSSTSFYITQDHLSSKTNDDYDTINLTHQQEAFDHGAKNSVVIRSSSSAVDTNHHNGPVTALALVLFFCVLSF